MQRLNDDLVCYLSTMPPKHESLLLQRFMIEFQCESSHHGMHYITSMYAPMLCMTKSSN